MRVEVLILLALALAFLVAWLLIPAWFVSGPNYSLRLMPWGFVITFFGTTYVVSPPTVYLVPVFVIDSALVPIIWRRSVYSLYLSALLAVLSLTMLIDTILFQQRYLQVRGFIITPTPNGYAYVELPHASILGVPTYLLIAAVAVALLNMFTRARWLGLKHWSLSMAVREYGALTAIRQALDRLGIPYVEAQDGIAVGDLVVRVVGDKVVLSLKNKVGDMGLNGGLEAGVEESIAYVIYEAVRESLRGLVTEVVEYAED